MHVITGQDHWGRIGAWMDYFTAGDLSVLIDFGDGKAVTAPVDVETLPPGEYRLRGPV